MSVIIFLCGSFRFEFLTRAYRMFLLPWTQLIYY